MRNHGGIPRINEEDYTLDIDGLVNQPKRLTLDDLKNEDLFPRMSTVSTIQCSGTRRIEQINEYPGDGDELINAPVCYEIAFSRRAVNNSPVGRRRHWYRSLDGC